MHGCLWVDWDRLAEEMIKGKQKDDEELDKAEVDKLEKGLRDAFVEIRNDTLGSLKESSEERTDFLLKCLQEFADWSATCTLKDPATKNIVEEVNKHQHFDKSCKKKSEECRFDFPRLPTTETIISVPSRILFKDDPEKEKEMLKRSDDIKLRVKAILNDKEIMDKACSHRVVEIDHYIWILQCIDDVDKALAYKKFRTYKNKDSPVALKLSENGILTILDWSLEKFLSLKVEDMIDYKKTLEEHLNDDEENLVKNMEVILKERLDIVLRAAEIPGETEEERFEVYKEALKISDWGYKAILKRDVDEIMINNYNKDFIAAWNGNMDIQICLDFFAVLTYITDYTYKDESGTLAIIKEALENCNDPVLQAKMRTVLHTYLTNRQAGAPEVLYRILPFLHLADSNIKSEFIHTGFKKNRSKFLKQIDGNSAPPNAIRVEGKDGKIYMEKEGYLEKYLRRPECLEMSLIQFTKRYEPVRKIPKSYNLKKFFRQIKKPDQCPVDFDFEVGSDEDYSSDDSLEEDESYLEMLAIKNDFICDGNPFDEETSIPLPQFIPLSRGFDGYQWMRKRSEKSIRYHKINKQNDPHEWYFAETMLYLPFTDEDELFPDDFEKCLQLYVSNEEKINTIREQVMPYLKPVTEAREKAEEFLSNIGETIDAQGEQDADVENDMGEKEHPDLAIKDPSSFLNDNPQEAPSTFRKITLNSDSELHSKIRGLDIDQRAVVDRMFKYAVEYGLAKLKKFNPWPVPPLLMVQGGAGIVLIIILIK